MNYQKIYTLLIDNAKLRDSIDGYKERHHIIPKSLGGSNDDSNLVNLTAREHFIAHYLLAKIHGGLAWRAVICMKGSNNAYVNSRLYQAARIKFSEAQTGSKHPMFGKKNPKRSEMNKLTTGDRHPMYGRKHSEETLIKFRFPKSEQHKQRLSKSRKGKYAGENHPMYGRKYKVQEVVKQFAFNYQYNLGELHVRTI